jgi:hypothetical protein
MLVLAKEMFDSPPVFAWVLPVFVRLQPGKEETFSPRHASYTSNALSSTSLGSCCMWTFGDATTAAALVRTGTCTGLTGTIDLRNKYINSITGPATVFANVGNVT